jgi:hypothetical protein
MLSTRHLAGLPDLVTFRRLTRSLATLDAILSPEWDDRYYSFDSHWSAGEMMASMRNGSGDHWFALICPAGIALHGLAHEAPIFRPGEPPPWLFAELPAEFHQNFLREPAFDTRNSTFCVWRLASDTHWRCAVPSRSDGDGDHDGSSDLLSILAGNPKQYVDFARDYYEVDIALADVAAVYRHDALSEEFARRLNGDVDYQALAKDLQEIGYPEVGEASR